MEAATATSSFGLKDNAVYASSFPADGVQLYLYGPSLDVGPSQHACAILGGSLVLRVLEGFCER
jgi:hypothetical protein